MFDFYRKHIAKKTADATAPIAAQAQQAEQRAASAQAKQSALTQAATLTDEADAAAFIAQCEFADARLKAADCIKSRSVLEQVLQAIRNTDRRVAKLMQTRLDVLLHQAAGEQAAARCIVDAQGLAGEALLTPNQVADLDRAWQAIAPIPDVLRQSFDDVRAVLRARLEAQAGLQRAVIDAVAALQAMMPVSFVEAPLEQAEKLARMEQQIAQHAASPEVLSLPRHLLADATRTLAAAKASLLQRERHHDVIMARQDTLSRWEQAPTQSLKADRLRREWLALPPLQDEIIMAPLQARMDALLQSLEGMRKLKDASAQELQHALQQQFMTALDGLEKAVQEGMLQIAAEHDKSLRAIDLKAVRPSEAQTAQLAKVRTELSHLQGWAKWGGNVSREELLKAAEELPTKSHAPAELAKKIGGLRERWKSLDGSAGPAPKELWSRFDVACSMAYAPAAAHFKQLGEERQANATKARAMIADAVQFAASSNLSADEPDRIDWKSVSAYCDRMAQAWHRLGMMDRKEKKQLDVEFDAAMKLLSEPLAQQRVAEVQRREQLIAEVAALNPSDRATLDKLRASQERWQQQAKNLPLERKQEQALWQSFRTACDAVFGKRKESAGAADAERRQHLQQKENLCAGLDSIGDANSAEISKLLRETKVAWDNIGPVPRAEEDKIEKRYKSAIGSLQKKLEAVQRAASEVETASLLAKLALCSELERNLMQSADVSAGTQEKLSADWQALPELASAFERILRARFDAGLTALSTNDRQYAAQLMQQSASFSKELLRLEIAMGVDSPPELSRERLQMQVEMLQASLKMGAKSDTPDGRKGELMKLCGMFAALESQEEQRVTRLVAALLH